MSDEQKHDPDSVYTTSGLAENGHYRAWAHCSTCGWDGPFRREAFRAHLDADAHLAKYGIIPRSL